MRTRLAALAACGGLALGIAPAASAAPALSFTTLGTNSGPIPRADRSEPANLVRYGDQLILTDVGDGAPEQLAKAGVRLGQVQTLVVSHLHFDHTGGLFAFLSLRFQSRQNSPLVIYGPPGTVHLVTQLFAAMRPGETASQTMGPSLFGKPEAGVKIVEIRDGAAFAIGDVGVRVAENSHYQTLGPPSPDRPVSLSYRFDVPGRSIVYTGDTGPSDAVVGLCKGADLLVSEIMDPALAVAKIIKAYPNSPPAAAKAVEDHFRREHLHPTEVGKLAAACGVKTVVATHNSLERDELAAAGRQIAAEFKGKVVLAEDLETF
ncbi:MAG: MBL fold metallo-hydrolase [Phenylobacterium sp.]